VTLFRILLALPAALVSSATGATLLVVALLGWFAALATGRMPYGLRNLGAFALRYAGQLSAYVWLLTDRYPNASPGLAEPPPPEVEPPVEALAA
jgi:hypothetical protein